MPSAIAELLRIEGIPAQVQTVNLAGESLPNQIVEQLYKQENIERVYNLYGPSEDTTYSTFALIEKGTNTAPTIGRPISNSQIYILDQYLQPVPIDVAGEIYLGGDGLARGYLNRPELTTEKFIPHPFSNQPNARLYKTGDLARYLPDGNIEYIGRIDHQVKIRGFRIELGEIEAVLNAHPQIQQALVMPREEVPGNKRLVAYIVSADESLTSHQLREFLQQKLPEYMVPSAWVMLDQFPLTANGKIDRQALPAPDGEITRADEYVAPRTPSEEIIANIFAQVLGVQKVGIHDNFFELGGHSLLATQLVSRLRRAFGVEIPLRAIFAAPTVVELNQTLTQLSHQGSQVSLPPIQPRKEGEELLLSWAQERLWFLNQLEGASATYNIPGAFRLTGDLDIKALQQALAEIVRRHEVLRTSFTTVNGQPVQVIDSIATINIKVVDLPQLPDAEGEQHLQQLVQQEAHTPFDLEIAPLIRSSLLRLSATEYVLLITMHHIVSDGWSIGVFSSELSALYQAFSRGEASPLPALAIQYADFTVWQREWLSGEILATQLNYWQAQLAGIPSLLQLPTDRPRPSIQTYRGNTQTFSLNSDLTKQLQTLSRTSGTTLFMTLVAAFATLLHRYSGESDILIGTPIANRTRGEIEGLIGFFVNTLVLRTQVENNPSFEELLTQVRETTLQAYQHQDLPFEQVVEALQPERSLSHSPLFQVMFAFQNTPMRDLELPGVVVAQLSTESTIAKFDLTLSMTESESGLVGAWEYNTDLFDGTTIERMATHFQNLLSAIEENPQQKVSEIPLLSAAERHQLLVEWNDTATEYPRDKCIHQLFEEQVEKTPLAVAVVFENQQLTYQELNQKSNQLAHYLQGLGVGPEVLVGICVERSLSMVIGLLGILKAGGAYVPIDPNYPQERVNFILADTQVSVLLTQEQWASDLRQQDVTILCLDKNWHEIAQHDQQNLITEVSSSNLAYTIFTSGSTGKPKAVQIGHRAVVNFLGTMRQHIGMTADDVLLGVTTFTFDIAGLEIFLPLIVGAYVVVAKREVTVDGQQLLDLLVNSCITVMQATPATWQLLLEAGWPNSAQLKILCGGEALPRKLAQELQARSSCLWNLYGPTETTIWSLIAQVDAQSGLISIGKPIANTEVYILDHYLQPVPIGVSGELHIGGAGLARCYLNRPELTAEKFIQNPFSDNKSKRLYQTGDLARYLNDGKIEYLGRMDNQVKIRGFRIELGEIEAVLNHHHQIQQAVVMSREDVSGNKRLVAYIVSTDESLTSHQLREFLKQKLPEYMVPSAWVMLDKLPLTANRKIDRQALPAPDGEISRSKEYIAPRTAIEQIIANIFAQVLNVQKVGIHDNFFELGGHSLLATQLVSRLRLAFDVEIPIRTIFTSPTVAQLDQTLTQLRTSESGLSLPPIQRVTDSAQELAIQPEQSFSSALSESKISLSHAIRKNSRIPLSEAQQYIWYVQQLSPESCVCNSGVFLRLAFEPSEELLERSINEIIRRYQILRTTFPLVNGQPVQSISPELTIFLNLVNLKDLHLEKRRDVALKVFHQEYRQHFDLASGPLIKITLLQLASEENWLLIPMHHIITDGWSINIFVEELQILYQAFSNGLPSPLPEVVLQYADFAFWQQQQFKKVLQQQLDYWLQKLVTPLQKFKGIPAKKRSTNLKKCSRHASFYSLVLKEDMVASLEYLSSSQEVTKSTILIAALVLLLFKWNEQREILMALTIGNRTTREIEKTLGCFINDVILHLQLNEEQTGVDLLKQIRETLNDMIDNKDIALQKVMESVKRKREINLLASVTINFPIRGLDLLMPGWDFLEVPPIGKQLWLAEIPLELYIGSRSKNSNIIEIEVFYSTDLFDQETIENLFSYYQEILHKLAELPEGSIVNLKKLEKK